MEVEFSKLLQKCQLLFNVVSNINHLLLIQSLFVQDLCMKNPFLNVDHIIFQNYLHFFRKNPWLLENFLESKINMQY